MKPEPRTTRAKAKAIQEVELPKLEKKPPTGDFFKDNLVTDSDVDLPSDHSDYAKPAKKRKSTSKPKTAKTSPVKKRKIREPSPEIPEISDLEYDEEREEDLRLFEKRERPVAASVKTIVTAKVLQLEVRTAPTTININIADLWPKNTFADPAITESSLDGSTLFGDSEDDRGRRVSRAKTPEDFASMRLNPKFACFLELEPELRNRVYRELLVANTVVKFNPAPRLSRTSAILRTCRQVHEEGRGILYGENSFHFDRTEKPRGNYWDEEWKEVGYKDVRRFLETIGAVNVAKLRFLSLHLVDAAPIFTPKLNTEERRYCNDPVLHHVLRLIGNSGCVLEKFVVGFAGRSELGLSEVPFVRAFTSISCRNLIQTCTWGHCRIDQVLRRKMEDFMKVAKPENVDEERRREPKMEHEKNGGGGCSRYRCYY